VVFVFDVMGEAVAMTGDGDLDIGFEVREPDAGAPADGAIPSGTTFPERDFTCAMPGPACPTTEPLRSEASRTVEVTSDFPTTTVTYVLSQLELPRAGPDPDGAGPLVAPAVGFNLDGLDSSVVASSPGASCEELQPDLASALDPGHVGVDNALEGLIPTVESLFDATTYPKSVTDGCIDAGLREDIRSGDVLILLEVGGLDSYVHDPSVQVTLYEGRVPGGGPPAVDAMGRLVPGQSFDTAATLASTVTGDVQAGRLRVPVPHVRLPIDLRRMVPEELSNGELRVDLAPSSASNGVLAGSYEAELYAIQVALESPELEDTIRTVLQSVADRTPTVDPAVCEDLSVGLAFAGVPATRLP